MSTRASIVSALAGSLAALASLAAAADTSCPSSQPAPGSTIAGSLVVGPGICALDGVAVANDVTVLPGAQLIARKGTAIGGNLLVGDGAVLAVIDSFVGSDVYAAAARVVIVLDSQIGGNLVVSNTRGDYSGATILGNVIGGSAQVSDSATPGAPVVGLNVVDGGLECRNNLPEPIGAANTVTAQRRGQCQGL